MNSSFRCPSCGSELDRGIFDYKKGFITLPKKIILLAKNSLAYPWWPNTEEDIFSCNNDSECKQAGRILTNTLDVCIRYRPE
jgi:hypothetical protein